VSARILVIEDNPANLDLMTYLLHASGYDVSYATDGLSGWERARKEDFDLVLTDILMPELDGYELARRFRGDAHLAPRRLIAVTALAMTGDREKIMAAGFDGYIPKPIEPQKFVGEVAAFLSKGDGKSSGH
jgi:CheY-like chemotaxis protein